MYNLQDSQPLLIGWRKPRPAEMSEAWFPSILYAVAVSVAVAVCRCRKLPFLFAVAVSVSVAVSIAISVLFRTV